MSPSEQRQDLLLQGLADSREAGRLAGARQLRHRNRALPDRPGGVRVGEHPVPTAPSSSREQPARQTRRRSLHWSGAGQLFRAPARERALWPPNEIASVSDPGGPAWLVLPTYNEAENIEALVAAVRDELPRLGPGAGRRRQLARRHRRDRRPPCRPSTTTSRSCTGRARKGSAPPTSPASATPWRRAPSWSLEMDADFSHDPAYLPRLLEAAERCRPGDRLPLRARRRGRRLGAAAPGDQPRRQRLRPRRPRARVRDLTGGFKCFRREVLEAIDLDSIRSRGYAFQVEMTYRAIQPGFRVVEVPIVFRDRRVGTRR